MTGMTLDIDERNGGAVLRMGGRVMYETDSQAFQQKLGEVLNKGKEWIVLDLSGVVAMSSTGLGILIAAHRTLTDKGTGFRLARLSEKVRSIIETTRLNTIFEIFDNVDEAVSVSH